jgi:hypothetical protein
MTKPELIQVHVLERKDKQKPDRDVYLGLYPDTPIKRKGEMVTVGDLKPDDIVWWDNEPLKVVWVRPWPNGKTEVTK